jgi:hypothetical protein
MILWFYLQFIDLPADMQAAFSAEADFDCTDLERFDSHVNGPLGSLPFMDAVQNLLVVFQQVADGDLLKRPGKGQPHGSPPVVACKKANNPILAIFRLLDNFNNDIVPVGMHQGKFAG